MVEGRNSSPAFLNTLLPVSQLLARMDLPAAPTNVCSWPECEVQPRPLIGRHWGESRHDAYIAETSRLTQIRYKGRFSRRSRLTGLWPFSSGVRFQGGDYLLARCLEVGEVLRRKLFDRKGGLDPKDVDRAVDALAVLERYGHSS